MADYTTTKFAPGSDKGEVYPAGGKETDWGRVEPLIDAEQIKNEILFGIPMVSYLQHPITKQRAQLTDATIGRIIVRAVSKVEELTAATLFPVQFEEKKPFDRNDYQQFGYMKLNNRPVSSIESLTITASNQATLFTVPLEWVDTGHLTRGQVNIIPLTIATTNNSGQIINSSAGGGAAFLSLLAQHGWVPSFWQVRYTAGYKDGMLPRIVNYLVGITAAIDILSMLGATLAMSNSASLGIDGLSQSSSGPGPNVYEVRIGQLKEEQKTYVKKVKRFCGLLIISGSV